MKTMLNGTQVNAFPEAVCMAVLEYYAFDADHPNKARALQNFRTLARAGMRAFIYTSLGFDPTKRVPDAFRHHYDRVMLNKVPPGMFSCFSETNHIVLTSIQAGLIVDQHTVPDISVGKIWSKHWVDHDLERQFGPRSKHPHVYPADYPQSAVTPDAFVYPIESLGVFRKFLDEVYLPQKYPAYLQRKVNLGQLPASRAELLIETLVPKALGSGDDEDPN